MYKSQQAIFSLYLAVLPSLAFSQASSSSQQTDDLLSRHKAAQAECVALFSAPTLAPLAGKVPFPVTQDIPTAAMLRLNRKPNAAEFKALESYSTMRRICFSKLAKAFVGEGDIPDYYKAYMDNWQSDIFVLRSGNVTFAEFGDVPTVVEG